MVGFKTLSALALSALAVANPVEKRAVTAFNANFDNLFVSPVSIVPIGVYDNLNYKGFFVSSQGQSGLDNHSPPNAAAYSPQSQAALLSIADLTIQGTNTKSFQLTSFYYGCAVDTVETVFGAAAACAVTATAFDTQGNQVYQETFNFTPATTTDAPMMLAIPPPSVPLSQVIFTTSQTNGVVVATLLDNVRYTTTT